MKNSLLFSVKYRVILMCVVPGFFFISCGNDRHPNASTIAFSHKTHVGNYEIKDCGVCHKYDAYGNFKGLPSVAECTACHRGSGDLFSDDRKANPRKKTMFDSYTDKDRLWKSRVKDTKLFYYSHKVAVKSNITDAVTRLRCDMCHGDKLAPGGTANTKGEKLMKQCIYCHTAYKLNNQCDVCHR